VTLTSWRICKHKYATAAFTGEGARRFGGRWNSPGTAVIYTAESQSLAALEMLVHLDSPDLLLEYLLIPVQFEDSLLERIEQARLPRNWRSEAPDAATRAVGDEWVRTASSAVFQVPSALLPAERNFLLNPRHLDFPRLNVGKPVSFQFDRRLKK